MSKRQERSSSSSSTGSVVQETKCRKLERPEMASSEITLDKIHSTLETLATRIDNRFSEISEELTSFRLEAQEQIKSMKEEISQLGKSLNELWGRHEEADTKVRTIEGLQKTMVDEIKNLMMELRKEKDRNLQLEAYTRRENLIFKNIPETERENKKEVRSLTSSTTSWKWT